SPLNLRCRRTAPPKPEHRIAVRVSSRIGRFRLASAPGHVALQSRWRTLLSATKCANATRCCASLLLPCQWAMVGTPAQREYQPLLKATQILTQAERLLSTLWLRQLRVVTRLANGRFRALHYQDCLKAAAAVTLRQALAGRRFKLDALGLYQVVAFAT